MRRRVKLKDVCRDITVGHVGPMQNEYVDEGIPFLRSQNILPFRLDRSNLKFITEKFHRKLRKSELFPGDVAVVRTGYPGTACVVPTSLPVANCADLVVIRPSKEIDGYYLCCLFNSAWGRSKVAGSLVGVAQQHFNIGVAREMEVTLPTVQVQKRIASILSAYDDLIENNTRRIKILEDMAQMLYREWFVNFRFPGHENVRMVESELGPIPEGWKVRKLSTLVKTQYGYTESATINPVGPKYLRGMDINKSSYIQWDTVPYCPIATTDHGSYRLRVGDIVVIRMADPGKVGMVEKDIDAVFASYLIRLQICDSSLSPYYLFSFLLSERYQDYVTGASTGTTRKSASAGVITDVPLLLPDSATCERYELFIRDSRRMLNNLLDRNSILRTTRDLLLPKLISGEISVEAFDEAAAELTEQTA